MNTITQYQQLKKIISLSNQVNWKHHKKGNIEFLFLLKTLRKHHILSKFLYNAFKQRGESTLLVSIMRLDYAVYGMLSAIDFCMTWSSTPEGVLFWSGIYWGTTELGQKIHQELKFYRRFLAD